MKSSLAKNVAKPTKSACNVLNVVLVLVICWMGFIYYYHVSASAVAKSAAQQDIAEDLINKIKSTVSAVKVHHEQVKLVASQAALNSVDEQKSVPKSTSEINLGEEKEADFHTAFSTDCSFFQDWQTLMIFHSAVSVQQKGKITRIASGCSDEKKNELTELYKKLYPQYGVHFTPDFKTDGTSKKKYDFYNKPYGVRHFLEHSHPPVLSGTVVNIIDPDMIFLRPMSPKVRGNPSNLFLHSFDQKKDVVPEKVQKGQPVAQLYGLGAPWTDDKHRHFNRSEICGQNSPCLKTSTRFGEHHFRY
jgi:hypothetical protein